MILILYENALKHYDSTKIHFYEFLVVVLDFLLYIYAFALITLKIKIFIIPKDSFFTFLILNAVFITVYHVKAVQHLCKGRSHCSHVHFSPNRWQLP